LIKFGIESSVSTLIVRKYALISTTELIIANKCSNTAAQPLLEAALMLAVRQIRGKEK
jgi:hypothetical protein